ncbi:beta-N-acetylglucosaminidase domain-containing protein [Amycolatopsis magusensis]|uniref:beta-N-acetylglucosaminidase domain-containing protein n=1 Tax=Amycolatopsis magusensis TaxID=882444 RepID=UPI0024A9C0D0|nr:beta-N-acetylglucosaminidase domain-containing protein [Amycolatopsis magusensis]MDI5979987.1 beta-N-acetylglucosaminidase domain-containing protein [Amycolatopsis magusensis]
MTRALRLVVALVLAFGLAPGPLASAAPVPSIFPVPQSLVVQGDPITVPPVVSLNTGATTDSTTVAEVESILRDWGVREIRRDRPAPLTIWLGTPQENPGAGEALRWLGIDGPEGLPAEGYVLASGRNTVVLSGVDGTGSYRAAATLRQLPSTAGGRTRLPAVQVRDWPSMPWRGLVEAFYGPAWTTADRLAYLDLAATVKLNTYVYAPKDDPYHRERWREPYPPDQLAELGRVAGHARDRHVRFVFAVSPGLDICHSAPAELEALTRKADALWQLGVRDFAVFFDDIGGGLHCPEDELRFGGDPSPLAAAQAHLLGEFQRAFLDLRPGAGRLITVPTEYTGVSGSVYQHRFGELVAPEVLIYWTGASTVPATITGADAAKAGAVFRHELLVWDNYPVNDYEPRKLFLGPLTGRAADLPAHGIAGLTANPMPQARPSALALLTSADYSWHPAAYQPSKSWQWAIGHLGGTATGALRIFADAARSSPLDLVEAPELASLIDAFWADPRGAAGAALADRFAGMAGAAGQLREGMNDPAFVDQAGPWLTKLRWYGVAGQALTEGLRAELRGDDTTAWRQRVLAGRAATTASEVYEQVAAGVVRPFLERATAASQVVTLEAGDGLSASVRAGETPIARVEFRSGGTEIGQDATAPYELDWSPPPGRHVLTARAVAANGEVVTSAPIRMTAGDPPPALLLTGTEQPAADESVRERLEYLGFPVVAVPAAAATEADATGKALIVAPSTIASSDLGTKFRETPVPLLTWESFAFDDLGMAGAVGETWRVDRVRMTEAAGPLAGGLTGEQLVYKGPNRVRWGVVPDSAERAATMPDDPALATLFGYPTGTPMLGTTAPAARVGLFLGDDGLDPDVVTPAALHLFDTAVRWAVKLPSRSPA